ncbi:hypothetical protein HNQ68_001946 [Pseudochrobactrum saccharolyticum]|uniref:Uncharacterized protein n=1 Tax=Pseudochrobactrum saccharolyticum TaxID=354352 RepID=A0A7W8ALG9_9HYPH|nr:hypothetical protein [Pseudochrobactrum saccharolyticum]MBB5091405.1 hypothetical protein [Pseudochrobactrum saccharolyticum]
MSLMDTAYKIYRAYRLYMICRNVEKIAYSAAAIKELDLVIAAEEINKILRRTVERDY